MTSNIHVTSVTTKSECCGLPNTVVFRYCMCVLGIAPAAAARHFMLIRCQSGDNQNHVVKPFIGQVETEEWISCFWFQFCSITSLAWLSVSCATLWIMNKSARSPLYVYRRWNGGTLKYGVGREYFFRERCCTHCRDVRKSHAVTWALPLCRVTWQNGEYGITVLKLLTSIHIKFCVVVTRRPRMNWWLVGQREMRYPQILVVQVTLLSKVSSRDLHRPGSTRYHFLVLSVFI